MFGLFKTKEIDPELLKQNVTESILTSWTNPNNLKYEKFDSFIQYVEASGSTAPKSARFMAEKLNLILCTVRILLSKEGIEDDIIVEIINEVKSEASGIDAPELKRAITALESASKEYAEIRFSTNARDAGKMIENKFSESSFGFVPSDGDIDRRYTLYKALTAFERATIFEVSNAIRKSQT